MINDYWFDFIDEMRHYWSLNKFIWMYLRANNGKGKIPSTHFWAILFIFLQMVGNKIKIVFPIGCSIITPQEVFKEMEDCYIKERKQECFFYSLRIIFRKLKRSLKKVRKRW